MDTEDDPFRSATQSLRNSAGRIQRQVSTVGHDKSIGATEHAV